MEPSQKRISDGSRHNHKKKQPPTPPPLDRLSDLPDCLLVLILNKLPIDHAVATSLLSSRWLNLWTHITQISLPPGNTPNFRQFHYFYMILERILFQLASPKIDTFHLEFNFHPYNNQDDDDVAADEVYHSFLLPWLEHVCSRNPEKIKVDFRTEPWKSTNVFNMATCVFNCESLVCLKLYVDFEFDDLPADMSSLINLPNLKKLCMRLRDENRVLMGVLFKSCPLLEELKLILELIEPDHLIIISAPNLRRLSIKLDENDKHVLTENCKFVIDAPNLQTLAIEGFLAFYEFVSIPTRLRHVMISIVEICFHDSRFDTFTRQVMGLLRGISCARAIVFYECGCHLLYCVHMLEEITLDGIRPPIFHRLRDLRFDIKLEGERLFPSCFLANLRKLEIQDLECCDLEIKLVEYILSNAPVMEQVHLSVYSGYNPKILAKELEYCKKMFKLPKISPICLMEFYGRVIDASSGGLEENGELTYRLVK